MSNPLENDILNVKLENSMVSSKCIISVLNESSDQNNNYKIMEPKFFFQSNSSVKSAEMHFKNESLTFAVNKLIYGCKAQKLYKHSFYHKTILYISEENLRFLQWISDKKSLYKSRIDLLQITLIYDKNKNINSLNATFDQTLYITYVNEKDYKKKLVLKFASTIQKKLFWQGLLYFLKEARAANQCRPHIDMIASKFFSKNNDHEKVLNIKHLRVFLKNRQIILEQNELQQILDKLNLPANENFILNKEIIKSILKELLNHNELLEIFSVYCQNWMEDKDNDKSEYYLQLNEIKKFFLMEQKQVIDDDCIKKIIGAYEDNTVKNSSNYSEQKISLSGFRNILFSLNNQIFDVGKASFYQDMSKPLTDYYIKSSHNTYLDSNQIIGSSSVEAYIKALSKGYRCIELDCWDGDKGEPIIYHVYTLTTKINFKDVIIAIVDYGFVKNSFPILLSIENHCCKNQQDKMADILIEICKESLFILPEEHEEYKYAPSPEILKYKIVVKTKLPIIHCSSKNSDHSSSELSSSSKIGFEKSMDQIYPPNKSVGSINKKSILSKKFSIDTSPIKNIENNKMSSFSSVLIDETSVLPTQDNFNEYIQQKNKNIQTAEEIGILGLPPINLSVKSISVINMKSKDQIETIKRNKTFKKTLKNIITIREMQEENQEVLNITSPSRQKEADFEGGSFGNKNYKNPFLIPILFHSENTINDDKLDKNELKDMEETNKDSGIENPSFSNRNKTHHYSIDLTAQENTVKNKNKSKYNQSIDFIHDKSISSIRKNETTLTIMMRKSLFSRFQPTSLDTTIDFSKISQKFLRCISLLGMKLRFDEPNRSVFSISSMNETRIQKILNEDEIKIIEFQRKFLTRIYPSGKRIDSSNYDPFNSFLAGCQMIALNIQTNDINLLIYNSIFQQNGGVNSGYVLKPKFLRQDSPKDKRIYPFEMIKIKLKLNINILSGQQISAVKKNNNQSFYLEICLRGCKQDESENKVFKSEIIKKNWFNPKFTLNAEFNIRCTELCFILFHIYSKNDVMADERIAWYCIPLNCIRQGYRVIPLLNNQLNPIENCFLFANIKVIKS